jgi:hypothetical protein
MKRLCLVLLAVILAVVCLGFSSIAYADSGEDGAEVDIGIVTGGDADVDIGVQAGGDLNVSVNGAGLATQQDIAGVVAGLGGVPGKGGTSSGYASPELHYYIYHYYIVPMRANIKELYSTLGLTMDGLAKLIKVEESLEAFTKGLSEEQEKQYEELTTRFEELENHRLSALKTDMETFTQSQMGIEHQIVMDWVDYRVALVEYNYNIRLGILLLMVIGLATALGIVGFKWLRR